MPRAGQARLIGIAAGERNASPAVVVHMAEYRTQELAELDRAVAGAPLLFVDFEASSLDKKRSYPIQFGWQRVRDGAFADGGAFLIRPAPDWDVPGAWDEDAARIHGLSRDALATGLDAERAAARTLDLVGDAVAVGDAPGFDRHWWHVLLKRLPDRPHPPVLLHFDELSARLVGDDAALLEAARLRACAVRPPTHQAQDDAAHLAQHWLELLRLVKA